MIGKVNLPPVNHRLRMLQWKVFVFQFRHINATLVCCFSIQKQSVGRQKLAEGHLKSICVDLTFEKSSNWSMCAWKAFYVSVCSELTSWNAAKSANPLSNILWPEFSYSDYCILYNEYYTMYSDYSIIAVPLQQPAGYQ